MDKELCTEDCLLEEETEQERGGKLPKFILFNIYGYLHWSCSNLEYVYIAEADNEGDNEEDEVVGLHFSDSEDDVNDGEFVFDNNTPERISVGLNSDPAVEEAHLAAGDVEIESDEAYYPSSEDLHTDYSSGENDNYVFPNFVPEKELFDPKFEVGKTFKDMELFRKAVRNHGVVSRCNLRFRPNDDRRAQAICKLGCKWRVWASLNKKLDCVQVKSYNPTHTCIRDRMNWHCTAKYVAERYLDTFRIDREWKTKLIRKAVKDDLKLNINKVTAWRARRWARILIEGGDEHQFGLLWSYAAEVERSNPGSTCRIASF
ncbi:DBD Tnp Mut domain-containing protein [Abeliophyllum distichum]|uniref:DBD Tnp Mut domain-containing protein n=1 Tax=Abeliophyllum distichum TaxID=126358 RepID=A0ABD1SZ22_9LAMI